MKRRRTRSIVAAIALALSQTTAPATAQITELQPLEPEMIDHGAEPRQLLRYSWAEGHAEALEATYTITTTLSLDGSPIMDLDIPMAVSLDLNVTDVGEDGSARMEFVYTRFDVAAVTLSTSLPDADDVEDAVSVVTDEMQEMTGGLIGVTGWQVSDDRGRVLEMGVDIPDAFPPELRQQFDQMSTVAMAAEHLPSEPVGLSARWASSGAFDSAGVPFAMDIETEVMALDATGVTLRRTMTMDIEDVSGIFGEMPPDMDVSIEEFTFAGGGETRVEFDGVAPEGTLAFDFAFEMAASGEEDGEPVSMDMRMEIAVAIETSVEDLD